MSDFELSLRLVGERDELERAATAMGALPYELYRKGQVYPPRGRAQPANVLILELATWKHGLPLAAMHTQILPWRTDSRE
jgi:hypothetical protein